MYHMETPQIVLLSHLHAFVLTSNERRRLCSFGDTLTLLDVMANYPRHQVIQVRTLRAEVERNGALVGAWAC